MKEIRIRITKARSLISNQMSKQSQPNTPKGANFSRPEGVASKG
jgi:hypothetical protein